MFDIGTTKMSSKGQVVIPKEMRDLFKEGDKLVVLREGRRLILRNAKDLKGRFAEDLEFARRTAQAWKQIEQGKSRSMTKEEFLKEIDRW